MSFLLKLIKGVRIKILYMCKKIKKNTNIGNTFFKKKCTHRVLF